MEPGILIASPQMRDPNFEGTVVLLWHHDEGGAMGAVVNRPTTITMGEVLSQLDVKADIPPETAVLWGGPVEEGAGFVIFQGEIDPQMGWRPVEGVAVSPSREMLEEVLRRHAPFHLCLGYAGWGPGQLEEEIATGSWLYTDIDRTLLFDLPLEQRYRSALARLGLSPEQVWMTPIDE